jgi:hypothetical protein
MFQYSKEEKDGYVAFTNSANKTSYRKYYNKGVNGVLKSISTKQNQNLNNREELVVVLEKGSDEYHVNFPVLNNHGDQLDVFTESLLVRLPRLELGKSYNINSYFLKKGDKIGDNEIMYDSKGVSVKLGDEKGDSLKPKLTYEYTKNRGKDNEEHVAGDIPALVWKVIAGKNKPSPASKEKRLEVLYDFLTAEVSRLSGSSNQSTVASDNMPPVSTPDRDYEEDDLPF